VQASLTDFRSFSVFKHRNEALHHLHTSHNGIPLGKKRHRYVFGIIIDRVLAAGDRKIANSNSGAARLRPALPSRTLPALTTSLTSSRSSSSVPVEEPKKKAQSILDSLPGNSLVSKTAILSSTAGAAIYALSNEYYVVNEETIVAFCLLSIWTAVFKYGGPMYKEWADGQVNKIKGILNAARADHTEAVKTRIESVQQLGSVVEITKSLFEVSKVRGNDAPI
jgi:F-type H+-transporting ATPase subunit b